MSSQEALVIGGGIAGIQAAIDLAERGIKVKLVEKEPSIGGRMAQLDKTFPTNDCSMCILAPKMIECFDHPNIEVMTYSEVDSVKGEAGNFDVTIRKKARFVNENCKACGDCTVVCPVDTPSEFDVGLSIHKAIYIPFPQAVPKRYVIAKLGAPCKQACPISMDVQGYIALIAQNKLEEAYKLIRRTNPLPSTCGRICMHPCEDNCRRNHLDQALAVAALKRFVCDQMAGKVFDEPEIERREEKIAIVGSGPAGLTAAHDLVLKGYHVTVFEALPVAGGMLAVGIPAYRLPKDVLQKEIDYIAGLGVEIKTNQRLGKDFTVEKLLSDGYSAVLLSVGVHKGKKLPIPGSDQDGVLIGTDFLRESALGNKPKVGSRVLVLGGGNVAFDCARTAVRLGAADVHMACLESRETMPAHPAEIREGEEEGLTIHPSLSFTEIICNGKVEGVKCVAVKTMRFDEEGKLHLETIPDSEQIIAADTVIFAIGQAVETGFLEGAKGVQSNPRGFIAIDGTHLTGHPQVFACGDAAGAPQTVVHAMASGRDAALQIDRYIGGQKLIETPPKKAPEPLTPEKVLEIRKKKAVRARERTEELKPEERKLTFDEVVYGYTFEQALEEAKRCLSCGVCSECRECLKACKAGAIDHEMQDELVEANVGAIVVAAGLDYYPLEALQEYGYGKYKNVLTAMEFERLICASGPTKGHIVRPSDHQTPATIGFIQCVGSRDVRCMPYCTSVCCMHSTKEAILANEHEPDLKTFIFYSDMRAMGKGFWAYTQRAAKDYNVHYVRCKPGSVKEIEGDRLAVWYEDMVEGGLKCQEVDMVVLAQALVPSKSSERLSQILDVPVDPYGFFQVRDKLADPVDSQRDGVFVCGFCQAPMDIPDSVVQASAAACKAAELLTGGVK